jgi:SAM-dependent methyltransferase
MATAYDSAFFSLVADGSLPSARAVVPLVIALLHPKSVVDVGCGPGAWLRAFVENGVRKIHGIDGEHMDRSKLLIDQKDFATADLAGDFSIDAQYDLALCIEVMEHLPEARAETLIGRLTSAAPVVLFSAAIPGQGGVNHVNERWPAYWRDLFAKRGFVMLDPFRPQIRDDPRISFWVRQNIVLFVSNVAKASYPLVRRYFEISEPTGCEWVHVEVYEKWFNQATKTRRVNEILHDLRSAVGRSVRRRLKTVSRFTR